MKVFGFTGPSGSGKTTLIEKLIPIFTGLGLRVSVIKHTHHDFDLDRPGKDSWRQRQAGAREVLLTSDTRWVLMHELRGAPEPDLPEQLAHLSPCDLVLVEGFKRQPIPKLEVWRAANDTPLLQPTDATIVAIAADDEAGCRSACLRPRPASGDRPVHPWPSWHAPYGGIRSNSADRTIRTALSSQARDRACWMRLSIGCALITPVTTASMSWPILFRGQHSHR